MNIKTFAITACIVGNLLFCTQTSAQDIITVHDSITNSDEEFDLPEGMTFAEDSLLRQWQNKNYLYPDTTCENPNFNPTYSVDIYQDRLRRLLTVMEMPYNQVVEKFIDQYSNRLRRSVSIMLGAGNFYMPLFEEALDHYNLPLELKYLPVIESALNPTAKSRVGATGLWQFMLPTAKRYDLEVNSLIDERCDPYKSTWAAAKYLRDLYKIYKDWNLVIAAYNCGPGQINKAIHRSKGERDYWKIYPYLPKETRGYVPAFIAANYIMNYYCDHNICPMKTKYPIVTDTVMITKDLNIQQVVELCNIDADLIRTLNPQYKTDIIPGYSKPSSLCLPQKELNYFLDLGDSIYNYKTELYQKKRYEVAVDETEIPLERQQNSSTFTRYSKSKSKSNGRHLSKKERLKEKTRHKDSKSKRDKKKPSSKKHAKDSKKKPSRKNEAKPSKHNNKNSKKGKKRR